MVLAVDQEPNFKIGKTVFTAGISRRLEEDQKFVMEVSKALNRYFRRDWGEMPQEDKNLNDEALRTGDDRIFASYDTSGGKVYIITEWDRSYTTVLFADEY